MGCHLFLEDNLHHRSVVVKGFIVQFVNLFLMVRPTKIHSRFQQDKNKSLVKVNISFAELLVQRAFHASIDLDAVSGFAVNHDTSQHSPPNFKQINPAHGSNKTNHAIGSPRFTTQIVCVLPLEVFSADHLIRCNYTDSV